jgi:hypothetical protein
VVKYLVGVLEMEKTAKRSFEICGDEIISYKNMIRTLGSMLGKRQIFIRSPFSSIPVYSYFTSLLVPVPANIIHSLMESVVHDVVCEDNEIKKLIPFRTISYKMALLRALSREDHDTISTRWSDAYPPAHELALKLEDLDKTPRFISQYDLSSEKAAERLFQSICRIGGKEGWFHNNWMWRTRGFIDRLMMGVGTSRGRRSESELRINDVIGFWRVEELKENSHLLLRAEMKVPGKAWLEFKITRDENGGNTISVCAYFAPKGFLGVSYWYMFLPFHFIIFKNLLKQIDARS